MTAEAYYFDSVKQYVHDGTIILKTDSFKGALITSSWTPNVATNSVWADISAHEVAAGNGYTAGGVALANLVVDQSKWDADDPVFANLGTPSPVSFRYFVIYKLGSANGVVDPLVWYCLFDNTPADITADNENISVPFNPAGILTW